MQRPNEDERRETCGCNIHEQIRSCPSRVGREVEQLIGVWTVDRICERARLHFLIYQRRHRRPRRLPKQLREREHPDDARDIYAVDHRRANRVIRCAIERGENPDTEDHDHRAADQIRRMVKPLGDAYFRHREVFSDSVFHFTKALRTSVLR